MDNKNLELKDIINYTPKTYITKEELNWVKSTFGGEDNKGLMIIRKFLLPSLRDPELPVEEMDKDIWMKFDFLSMSVNEVKDIAASIQVATKLVAGALIDLTRAANQVEETEMEAAYRRSKDSAK